MSRTAELADAHSPITQYVRFVGTIVADAGRGAPWAGLCRQLLNLDALKSDVVVQPVAGANPAQVGTAFDYRLRYHLAPCRGMDFVAANGAAALIHIEPATRPSITVFFRHLDEFTTEIKPAGKLLDAAAEELLSRYCVVLAQLESVYRSSGAWTPTIPPLGTAATTPANDAMLQLASELAVADVVNLSRSARATFGPLIDPVVDGRLYYVPNPVFAGSGDIGGADADFIIGKGIFELKTTKEFTNSSIRKALLQLVGYCLLDYDDRYEIRAVGLYFSRQERVISWPAWGILFPPAEVLRYTVSGDEPSEAEVLERFTKVRGLMKRVVRGEVLDLEAEFS